MPTAARTRAPSKACIKAWSGACASSLRSGLTSDIVPLAESYTRSSPSPARQASSIGQSVAAAPPLQPNDAFVMRSPYAAAAGL